MPRPSVQLSDCPFGCRCGYVVGATSGYPKLTSKEREALVFMGYEIAENVHGDEIARPSGRSAFNTARFELHKVICRPTRLERI